MERKFINLGDYGLVSTSDEFDTYLNGSTLVSKARTEGYKIDLSLKDNVIRTGVDTHSYEAALVSDFLRRLLITKGQTFSFETVMSHPSKLETLQFAIQNGFRNYLYFISTEDSDINIRRVEQRVQKGGHSVDPQKIAERYQRSMKILSNVIPLCYRCFILDNSREEEGYRLILEVVDGKEIISYTNEAIPLWVETYVLDKLGV